MNRTHTKGRPKQVSRATLQRKIRRLQADKTNLLKWEKFWFDGLQRSASEIFRLYSLLQAYKDRETDKAHRIIRKDP